jgi:hypothetical protein
MIIYTVYSVEWAAVEKWETVKRERWGKGEGGGGGKREKAWNGIFN